MENMLQCVITSPDNYVPLEGVLLANSQTVGLSTVKDTLVFSDFPNVCVNHCLTLPQSPSVGAWRMSAKSSRCYRGICSADNLLHTAGFLPKLMAFLWQFYFLAEMWPQGLAPRIIVTLIRKWVQCSGSFELLRLITPEKLYVGHSG